MKINTNNFKNFVAFVEAYEDIILVEGSTNIISGYKVYPSGEIAFNNSRIELLADCHNDAWLRALDEQEL